MGIVSGAAHIAAPLIVGACSSRMGDFVGTLRAKFSGGYGVMFRDKRPKISQEKIWPGHHPAQRSFHYCQEKNDEHIDGMYWHRYNIVDIKLFYC